MNTTAQPTRAATPIAFIQAMVRAYERRDLDPSAALQKAQIAPNLLQQADARVTALQMEWMSEAAMRELDDEALGWFRRRLPWGCLLYTSPSPRDRSVSRMPSSA